MNKQEIKNLIGKDSPIIFEIGCADGIDTQDFIDTFGPDLEIHCFEPDPRNLDVFLNGGERVCNPGFTGPVKGNSISVNSKAVGDIDGKCNFYQTNTIYSSSLKKPNDNLTRNWPQIELQDIMEIDTIRLDTYVAEKNIGIIDFIWADVQGGEDLMIKGGADTFKNKVRYLYTEYAKDEVNSYYDESPHLKDIINLLGENWIIYRDFGSDVLLKNTNI
jgi:FkbM family methyltransferase